MLNAHDETSVFGGNQPNMILSTFTEVSQSSIGNYVNMLLYIEVVEDKQTLSGDVYAHLNVVDTSGERNTLQVFDYVAQDFSEEKTILVCGLLVKPGRSKIQGVWQEDNSWGQARYSAYRTAIAKVGILDQNVIMGVCCKT